MIRLTEVGFSEALEFAIKNIGDFWHDFACHSWTEFITTCPGGRMANDKHDVLQVLERNLSLLENGWYELLQATSWRASLVFEDSPTCPNFIDQLASRRCSECVLMQFVPLRFFGKKVPCRHIPLNDARETVDTLYRSSTMQESKVVLRHWLLSTINRLKEKRARLDPNDQHSRLAFFVPDAT